MSVPYADSGEISYGSVTSYRRVSGSGDSCGSPPATFQAVASYAPVSKACVSHWPGCGAGFQAPVSHWAVVSGPGCDGMSASC